MRRQKPVKGGRAKVGACVVREIDRELRATARRFGVSKSFVQATALADALGIDIERYTELAHLRVVHRRRA